MVIIMKRLFPLLVLSVSAILIFAGCENPFGKKSKTTVAPTTTTTATSVQGNSEVITLNEPTTTTAVKKYEYHSVNLGVTVTIPEAWVNKYAIEDSTTGKGVRYIRFYEKNNHSSNGKGLIFTYKLYPADKYKARTTDTQYGTLTTPENTTYYIVCSVPSKPQYDTKSTGLTKAYEALCKKKYINSICNSAVYDSIYDMDRDGSVTQPSATESLTGTSPGVSGTTSAASVASGNGLVFPDISTRRLTDKDLRNLSRDRIQQAINDICALHGYNFTTASIKAHYQQFSWYKPSSSFSEDSFNSTEKYNYRLLQRYRN